MSDTATKITKQDVESIDLIEPNLAKDAASGYQRVPLDLYEFERNMITDVKERFSLGSNRETLRVMIHYFHSHMDTEPYDDQLALFNVESNHGNNSDHDPDHDHSHDHAHDEYHGEHENHDEQNHDEWNHRENNDNWNGGW